MNELKQPKVITIEIGGDNTGLMKSLNEIEEKIDRIMEKANRLIEILNECYVSEKSSCERGVKNDCT